jgi:hypothetical protein
MNLRLAAARAGVACGFGSGFARRGVMEGGLRGILRPGVGISQLQGGRTKRDEPL